MKKTVLITGGSRGIGAAMVKKFTDEDFSVAFFYRSADERAEKVSRETGALGVKCDVADREQVKAQVKTAKIYLETQGFDTLICNAGISRSGLFTELTEEEWREILDVNLNGCVYTIQEVLPEMVRRKRGTILMVSSVWGQTGASCEVAYSTTKAAVIGLTKSLAKELAPSGIRVNCIAPGVVDTEMNGCYTKESLQELCEEIPMGRLGLAEEIANTAYFLSTEQASYVTGQVIGVNGGFYL